MTDKKEEKDRKRREPLRITVRLSPPLAEKLQDLVESGMYKNLSEVVRKALSDLIKTHYPPPHRSTVTVDLPLSLKKELEKLVEEGEAIDLDDAIRNALREYIEFRVRRYVKASVEEEAKKIAEDEV